VSDIATGTTASPAAELYELRSVERRYLKGSAEVRALREVDLDIQAGEFVSIEGPSGSGKSTLLTLLGALDTPTAGTVRFEGQDLSRAGDRALTDIRSQKIGFIFQQFNLIPTLTAAENVAIAIPRNAMSKSERRARAADLLGRVGLGSRLHHLPTRLSGGEQQRVAIARALANAPEVIVADEPTGNLDSESAAEVMALLLELRSEGTVTVIVATHDEEVARQASRRVRMRDGRITPAPGSDSAVR
jgi:putative ABC transport system ATP-binding protein